ncbi:MAG: orotate phosphoribosyltransferase [Phototrophicaceae bacterium]
MEIHRVSDTVARILLEIGAVRFTPNEPITFKSGIRSPIYVDNRVLPYWPQHWRRVIVGFLASIEAHGLDFDVIAGIETAGIPHSAALAYTMHKPSVFVRKEAKAHGTQSRIEGGSVKDRRVLLVEDLITTGGSSLSGIEALRSDGAVAEDCIAIVSYGFSETVERFTEAGTRLFTLTSFPKILEQATAREILNPDEAATISDWLSDPHGWAKRQGK